VRGYGYGSHMLPPPTPSPAPAPGPFIVPAKLQGQIVRCDYAMVDGRNPLGVFAFERDSTGAWTMHNGSTLELTLPAGYVAWTRVSPSDVVTKKTPAWAVVLGLVGIFLFLIGLLFFLVKTTEIEQGALVEIGGSDGRVLAFRAHNTDATILRAALGAY